MPCCAMSHAILMMVANTRWPISPTLSRNTCTDADKGPSKVTARSTLCCEVSGLVNTGEQPACGNSQSSATVRVGSNCSAAAQADTSSPWGNTIHKASALGRALSSMDAPTSRNQSAQAWPQALRWLTHMGPGLQSAWRGGNGFCATPST